MSATNGTHDCSVPDDVNVKIPLQRRWPPDTVRVDEKHNGEWERHDRSFHELPTAAQRAFLRFNGVPQEVRKMDSHPMVPGDPSDYPKFDKNSPTVWMCKQCAERDDEYGDRGYLTQQKACKTTVYRTPSCSHTYEEEYNAGRGISGVEWGASEAWGGQITLDGERSAHVSADYDRKLEISLLPEWDYTVDPVDTTVVDIPESGTVEVTRETGGKEWTATIDAGDTVTVEWRREIPDGEVLEGIIQTNRSEKECNGSSFKKVYPKGRTVRDEDYLPLDEMGAADFPNHASHFGRMVPGEDERALTGSEMTEAVAEAVLDFYQQHR